MDRGSIKKKHTSLNTKSISFDFSSAHLISHDLMQTYNWTWIGQKYSEGPHRNSNCVLIFVLQFHISENTVSTQKSKRSKMLYLNWKKIVPLHIAWSRVEDMPSWKKFLWHGYNRTVIWILLAKQHKDLGPSRLPAFNYLRVLTMQEHLCSLSVDSTIDRPKRNGNQDRR
jgi:hypothetical protein